MQGGKGDAWTDDQAASGSGRRGIWETVDRPRNVRKGRKEPFVRNSRRSGRAEELDKTEEEIREGEMDELARAQSDRESGEDRRSEMYQLERVHDVADPERSGEEKRGQGQERRRRCADRNEIEAYRWVGTKKRRRERIARVSISCHNATGLVGSVSLTLS
jgi:hypothetical protein